MRMTMAALVVLLFGAGVWADEAAPLGGAKTIEAQGGVSYGRGYGYRHGAGFAFRYGGAYRHYHGYGHYRNFYSPYAHYRPFYYGGYRASFYASAYYQPYPVYSYPVYYQSYPVYYPSYPSCYYAPVYYGSATPQVVIVGSSTSYQSNGNVSLPPPNKEIYRNNGYRENAYRGDQTFPYDGGPERPFPMPDFEQAPPRPQNDSPRGGEAVLGASASQASYAFPAYGETRQPASAKTRVVVTPTNTPRVDYPAYGESIAKPKVKTPLAQSR